MVTDEQDNGTEEELDLSPGMVPHHNLGIITAYDHDSGLPIVKRKTADAPSSEPAKQDTAATPEPEKPEPRAEPKTDAKPTLSKGAPVTVNGKSGKVVFVHQGMGIARIKPDDGSKPITARVSAIQVQPHVVVQSHIRKLPQ